MGYGYIRSSCLILAHERVERAHDFVHFPLTEPSRPTLRVDVARVWPSRINVMTDAATPFGAPPPGGRHPDGTFASRTTTALTHGGRSRQVRAAQRPGQTEAPERLAERRAAIMADLGGEQQLSQLQRDLIERYIELDMVASWLGSHLVAEGPLTAKGRTRAALSAYVTVVDRIHRVGGALGVARRPKMVPDLTAYLASRRADPGEAPPSENE